jgi:hypothetical protein
VAAPDPPAQKATPQRPTTTTAERGETRTISSRGGSVAVRYQNNEVRLLWARPNSGYDVAVVDDGPDKVFVRFRNDKSRSRVYAYYKDGKPVEEVVERGGGKDEGDFEPKGYQPVRQESDDDLERWREYRERFRR